MDRSGIIPALAGNTTCSCGCRWYSSDHPRSRGEYPEAPVPTRMVSGSSPLSRGIRQATHRTRQKPGIIPALAGNTHFWGEISLNWGDHPRSRGEYLLVAPVMSIWIGSSPLSRGIHGIWTRGGCGFRIIPALAGNTGGPNSYTKVVPDHPRSRGEYAGRHFGMTSSGGSSPLSRGILDLSHAVTETTGIIPALAGNTSQRSTAWTARGDHPRSRGEYTC